MNDLGRHPKWCADHSVSLAHRVGQLTCDAEVGELGSTLQVEENVARLDVAVDLLAQVEILESAERVANNGGNLILEQRLADASHDVEHRAGAAVLHHYPQVGVLDVAAVVLDDVHAVGALLHVRYLAQDLHQIGLQAYLLDGHGHARLAVQCLVHAAVAALADARRELEYFVDALVQVVVAKVNFFSLLLLPTNVHTSSSFTALPVHSLHTQQRNNFQPQKFNLISIQNATEEKQIVYK